MKNRVLPASLSVIFFLLFASDIFAQTFTLGTAGKFVVFTTTGAVGNTGISQITGDVGTNNGGITGFGNVNGVMHTSDGATASAANDLLTAYNFLSSTPSTASHAPLLGNGDTLLAGVYNIAGQTTLNNALYLNAKGDANAVFTFKISAVFNTTASSQVILINGALACNVRWVVEGAVNIGSLSVLKGTIIAHNGAIDLATGAKLEGRALSTTGAVTVNGITAKVPIGCGSAVLTGPTAPNLASTLCYAIFSRNGEVTNNVGSITHVRGDVGTNVGLTSGYNPLTVEGMIHTIPDNSTAMASADLLNVRTYLNDLTPDIELLYPAQFGRGLVLTPHTYVLNGGTSFVDTLFLNAEGNTDAVFVIKIYGALSTGTYATVKLINGTDAKNVYWLIGGAVSINNNANIKGTIICHNGAINLNTDVTVEGRIMTTDGALHTASVDVIMPAGCATLPLSLTSFKATLQNNNALLNWTTISEQNTLQFEVEQSIDATNFLPVGKVAAAGNSTTKKGYSFNKGIHLVKAPLVYFRLKLLDTDGRFTYSNTVSLKLNPNRTMLQFYPNPAKDVARLNIFAKKQQNVYYTITSSGGRIVRDKQAILSEGNNVVAIDIRLLAAGVYTLTIKGLDTIERIQFVKL